MPSLGYGVFLVPPAEAERCVSDAISVGYWLIDTAQAYYNEEGVGAAVAKSGIPREEFFLVTKLWVNNNGEAKAAVSIDESLRKLQTDYIDLLLIHQAYGDVFGTWRAMEQAYKVGKVRAIGVSNFQAAVDEMMRSRKLCAIANAKMPDDMSYIEDLEELFGRKLEDVRILTPFICDFGNRVSFGKGVFINHSAVLSASGGIEFEDGVAIAPCFRVATINHDFNNRHTIYTYGKVTIKKNAWIGMNVTVCPVLPLAITPL